MGDHIYEDDQCCYCGGDPRLDQLGAAIVTIDKDVIKIVVCQEGNLYLPRKAVLGVCFEPQSEWDMSELPSEVITDVLSSDEFTDSIRPGVTLRVGDPEGVFPDGFRIGLTFRNEYFARVFEKRLREAYALES